MSCEHPIERRSGILCTACQMVVGPVNHLSVKIGPDGREQRRGAPMTDEQMAQVVAEGRALIGTTREPLDIETYPAASRIGVEDMEPLERAWAEAEHEGCSDGDPHPLEAHSPWSGGDLEGVETWPSFMARLARHGLELRFAARSATPSSEEDGCVVCFEPSHDIDYHDHHYHPQDKTTYIGEAHATPDGAGRTYKPVAISLLSTMKGIARDRTVTTITNARAVAEAAVSRAEAAIADLTPDNAGRSPIDDLRKEMEPLLRAQRDATGHCLHCDAEASMIHARSCVVERAVKALYPEYGRHADQAARLSEPTGSEEGR